MTCPEQFAWLSQFTVGMLAALVLSMMVIAIMAIRPEHGFLAPRWLAAILPEHGK